MTKKIISIILSILVLAMVTCFIFMPKKDFSEEENRKLAKFPEFSTKRLFNGDFIEDLETYFSDQFPLRNLFITIKTKADLAMGKTYINNVYIAKDGYLIEDYKKPIKTDLFIKAFNNFSHNNPDIKASLMLVPTSIEANSDKLPSYAKPLSQLETMDYIYQNVEMATIDVFDALNTQNLKQDMYYHLDHHWATDGAYYAYLELAKAFGLEAKTLDYFDRVVVSYDFRGTIYSKVMDKDLKPDEIVRYLPKGGSDLSVDYTFANETITRDGLYADEYLETKNQYSSFMYDNNALVKITNHQLDNDKKLVVVKDSYANCFIPFLVEHYEEIHVIDPRYYTFPISEYLKQNDLQEILFLYNLNTLDTNGSIYTLK